MKKNNVAVSLIELLVAIAIIVTLAGIAVPAISFIKNRSKNVKTQNEIAQLNTALMAFFTDNGSYPKTGELLASLGDKYFNFDASRIENGAYKDPYGEPYVYISPSRSGKKGYELYSLSIMSANDDSTSDITSGDEQSVVIGKPSRMKDKTIWGLDKPEYGWYVKSLLNLLRSTNAGYKLAALINIANVPIYFEEMEGKLGYYYPYPESEDFGIYLNSSLINGPIEATTAVLAHEATHLVDHLSSGDMYFDSIEEEYDAFYNEAMVWRQLKGSKVDATQNQILSIIRQGEKNAKVWIRSNYPYLSEKDEWGDSYVVAKRY